MALRFYFDTHIPKVAARQLQQKGIDVVRCEDIGMAEASDEDHLAYAAANARIMVSVDVDFASLHKQWQRSVPVAVLLGIPLYSS